MSEEHIYYDLDIINNDSQGNFPDQPLNFTETRNTPFVDNPMDYFMSIVRFEISNTSSLPVFIPEIKPNQDNVHRTIYEIYLTCGSWLSGFQPVLFYGDGTVPSGPVGIQQNNDPYYHVYNYESFIRFINIAFIQAYNVLRDQSNDVLPASADNAPFLTFNNDTKKISIYAIDNSTVSYDNDGLADYNIKIFINQPLRNLLNSFNIVDHKYIRNNAVYPLRYQMLLTSTANRTASVTLNSASIPKVSAPSEFLMATSQDVDISIWNPISSIVFTSFIIPVVPTNTSTPSSLLYNSGNNNNSANIITDFQVNIDANNSYRQSLLYVPTSEYRLFSMNNSQPLNSIDIRVWWKDKYGRLNPFLLTGSAYANMKIMFRKKIFNNQ
jgi:hypothetical protein